ncbi:MAG: HPF/RaiA family ribosome-associated protein [Holosporaceae bacterium]|jgi:ribosomal subunit interface protein|nr:HPF/RaiA family ribosome-associated protein [Holosporaceae bacterium]
MSFSLSCRHMEIGESLTESKAKEASFSLAKKYGMEFIDVNIIMTKDGRQFRCDVSIKTSEGDSYHSSSDANDSKVSFDSALQKIDRQMQKKSERSVRKHSKVEINVFDNSLEESAPAIIAEILNDLPIMSVSDAAKRLTDEKRAFIFENISNNSINVVYIRPDHNIGWIDYKK